MTDILHPFRLSAKQDSLRAASPIFSSLPPHKFHKIRNDGPKKDHNEHPLEKHGRDALLEFRAEIHAKQPAEAEKQGHAPVGGDAQVGIEGRNGYVEENAGQRVDEGRRQPLLGMSLGLLPDTIWTSG